MRLSAQAHRRWRHQQSAQRMQRTAQTPGRNAHKQWEGHQRTEPTREVETLRLAPGYHQGLNSWLSGLRKGRSCQLETLRWWSGCLSASQPRGFPRGYPKRLLLGIMIGRRAVLSWNMSWESPRWRDKGSVLKTVSILKADLIYQRRTLVM